MDTPSKDLLEKLSDDAFWARVCGADPADQPADPELTESDVDDLARIDAANRPAVLDLRAAAEILHEPFRVTLEEQRKTLGLRCRDLPR
jgi:hypothetical protein